MKSKGRPPTREVKLMDGFYIEIRNKGSKERGVKIRNTDLESMEAAARQYERNNKEVIRLGEFKNGKGVNQK